MNIQIRPYAQLLQTIISAQEQLQIIRQLLNQELAFDLYSTFSHITHRSQKLDLSIIRRFLASSQMEQDAWREIEDKAIESMIKYYSCGSLYLTIEHWKNIVLSRQDRLLNKLARERQNTQREPPQYILSYCMKILKKQCRLHSQIINNQHRKALGALLSSSQQEEEAQKLLSSLLPSQSAHSLQILRQYMKRGIQQDKSLQLADICYLLLPNNSKVITAFLQKKQSQQKQNKMNNNQVLVHREFRKLDTKCSFNKTVMIRQAKSIQSHMHRNHNPSNKTVRKQIKAYSSKLEGQLRIFLKGLDKIMKYNNAIAKHKYQLVSTNQTNFSLLFDQISTNRQIIASQLQHYLQNIHITLPLSSLFVLFKKYCDPVTGKINKKQFKTIFKLYNSPNVLKLNKMTQQFRQKACLCLLYQIQVETKIQEVKTQIMRKIDLRQVFDAIDADSDRQFSQTDLRIMSKKIIGKDYKQDYLNAFWWRMSSSEPQTINYDIFMYEMIPKIKEKFKSK